VLHPFWCGRPGWWCLCLGTLFYEGGERETQSRWTTPKTLVQTIVSDRNMVPICVIVMDIGTAIHLPFQTRSQEQHVLCSQRQTVLVLSRGSNEGRMTAGTRAVALPTGKANRA
jgi:hypothetical protein